jgi:hypothetical protein
MHKGYKCLDIFTRRIYISRDVVFDETVFPFADLHSNAGARLKTEINLLPSTLLPLSNFDNMGHCQTTDLLLSNNPTIATNVETSQDADNDVQVTGTISPSVASLAAPQPAVEHIQPVATPPIAPPAAYKRQPQAKKATEYNPATDEGSDSSSLIPEVSVVPISASESAPIPETTIYTDQRPCTRLRDGTTTRVKYGCFTSTGSLKVSLRHLMTQIGNLQWMLSMRL